MDLIVEVHGADIASRTLRSMGRNAVQARPLMADILHEFELAAEATWRTQGKGHWPELDPDTTARKREAGLSPHMLVGATHELERSLMGGGRGAIREVRHDSARFGTRVEHAVYQQGKRPLIILDRQNWSHVFGAIRRWVSAR